MESRQREGKLGGILLGGVGIQAHDAADHPDEREEEDEHPDDAEHVEHQVRHRRPPCLRVRAQRSQVRRDRRADVLAHHQGDALEDGNRPGCAEDHRDGHQRRRALHQRSQDRADQKEKQDRAVIGLETREEGDHLRLAREIHFHTRLLEHPEGEQQEGKTEEEIAEIAVLADLDQDDADKEGRPHDIDDVEGEAGGHDPRAHRRADVGPHDNRDGLSEGKQGRIHERDRHDGGRGGRLDRYGHQGACRHAGEPVRGHRAQQVTQLRARHLLEGLAHHLHSEYQEGDRAQELQGNQHVCRIMVQRYTRRSFPSREKINCNRILMPISGFVTAQKSLFPILRKPLKV